MTTIQELHGYIENLERENQRLTERVAELEGDSFIAEDLPSYM